MGQAEPPFKPARKVLVADDDPGVRLILRHCLEAAGFPVDEANATEATRAALRTGEYAVALVDILMPGAGGLEILSGLRGESIETRVVVITAASTMDNAVEAMKRGAYDYLTKPFQSLATVVAAVTRAAGALPYRPADLRGAPHHDSDELVGRSPAMQEVYKLIGRVVDTDATILLEGESGTGKELVARAIHFKSSRRDEPFEAINCSAIPEGLLESVLFGHERGSFTGASERRTGKFEQVGRGTLLLDEIGDMPLSLQPKLLRVLQTREFTRVGGGDVLTLNARIIAATNQDLQAAIANGRFRQDLYFRLHVMPIRLPPLRERCEDIPELAGYFLTRTTHAIGTRAARLSPGALAKLQAYAWPGNVRELENTVIRAALMAAGSTVEAGDIALVSEQAAAEDPVRWQGTGLARSLADRLETLLDNRPEHELAALYREVSGQLERVFIEIALKRSRGNQLRAAQLLGVNRNTLRKKITAYNLRPFPG